MFRKLDSLEMSADFQQTTQHYIPDDRTLHNHHCENLKFYKKYLVLGQKKIFLLVF
jgi:hypothetical protein